MKCSYCNKEISVKEEYKEEEDQNNEGKIKLYKIYDTIKRDKYFRIFKDKEEIDKLNLNKDIYYKLKEMNCMTKEEFKKKYIIPLYNNEKGLHKIDKNNYKNDNRKIRNLSQNIL